MDRRTVVFLLVGLLAGSMVTALSGLLGGWDVEWWESILANGGVTLFLAVPVAIFLARLSKGIDSVGKQVTTIQADVEQAKSDIEDLREGSARAAAELAERNNQIFSADSSDRSPQRLADLLDLATSQGLISELGYRIAVDNSERRYLRFFSVNGLVAVKVQVEGRDGNVEFSQVKSQTSEVAAALGEVYNYLVDNGHQLTEPFGLVEELFRQVEELRKLRGRGSDLIARVQESMPGGWYVADSSIFHINPDYQIGEFGLRSRGEEFWLNHLRGKGWVEYDEALSALEVAYALVVARNDPPF